MKIPPSGGLRPGIHVPLPVGSTRRPGPNGPMPAAPSPHLVADALDVAAQFVVDESTQRILVRIYNSRTGETIGTIPPTLLVYLLIGVAGGAEWIERVV